MIFSMSNTNSATDSLDFSSRKCRRKGGPDVLPILIADEGQHFTKVLAGDSKTLGQRKLSLFKVIQLHCPQI